MAIQILIADDHPILLEGVATVLEKSLEDIVIHRAENGLVALQKVIDINPEITILDIEMPHLDGIEVAKKIKQTASTTKIVFLTLHKEPVFFYEIEKLEAEGYVLKEFSTLEIATCVKEVLAGRTYFGKGLEEFIKHKDAQLPDFTKSEKHILALIADGKTTKEIAEMLFTSPKTIDSHRYNIAKKLDLKPEKNSLLKWVLKNSYKVRN